jgi:hypothetical protein
MRNYANLNFVENKFVISLVKIPSYGTELGKFVMSCLLIQQFNNAECSFMPTYWGEST